MATTPKRRRGRRATTVVAIAVVLAALAVAGIRLWPGSPMATRAAARWETPPGLTGATGDPDASPTTPPAKPSPKPTLKPLPVAATDVKIDHTGWYSWALLDTRTGKMSGPADRTDLSTTASLIKSWIGADFLRRSAEQGTEPSASRMAQVSTMIRDSDNNAAQSLYEANGGSPSIKRLISMCKLKDSKVAADGGWSRTLLSPADVTRLGACIANGTAAGPKWTKYLLDEMRAVRGTGNFGIRKAFPAADQKKIAIKNGWVDRQREQEYHVSCMAIGDGWVVGVMTKYDISKGYTYGANICEQVGEQLRAAAG
ncbi:Beta-lactamase enzyme family protein [Asanoa hainanensis]|uniref:Beta-lactamase enzyme family protein n=1 Tax=Asanoa hainanensis TaxID=560556 RepID=A0A239NQB1_9ACTN|nr:serine hydrolase [Asanoa hainanensis]SNT57046.1 Beta-lactamase enzyme family protein [Asanoa hainanensis]